MSLSYTTGNPANLTAGTTASMTDISGPFTDIKTFLTDGSGAVGDTILASPTNGVWRTVLGAPFVVQSFTTAVWWMGAIGPFTGASTGGMAQGIWNPPASGDVAVAGKTTRLRLRVPYVINATVPGINVTWGLYPITNTGGGGSTVISLTLGTVIAGSTAVAAAPIINGTATGSSFDFSAVTGANAYIIGATGSGSQAANSMLMSWPTLEMRHT